MSRGVIRVLIIEDLALVRAGLRKLIEGEPRFLVVGEIGAGAEDCPLAAEPDVAVIDVEAGDEDELGVLSRLVERHPNIRILILSSSDDSERHCRAVELGATGILLKSATPQTFFSVLEHVAAGTVWLNRATVAKMMSRGHAATAPSEQGSHTRAKLTSLSKREREIVDVACEGLRNDEIAKRLFISPVTVRHHLTAIFAKLGVPNRHSLMAFAYRNTRQAGAA